jgi:hypothetical protein
MLDQGPSSAVGGPATGGLLVPLEQCVEPVGVEGLSPAEVELLQWLFEEEEEEQ